MTEAMNIEVNAATDNIPDFFPRPDLARTSGLQPV
jgi:hypothetical protein